nr:MAG TPA: hypothetical protein [Caudoviricetes sp.]
MKPHIRFLVPTEYDLLLLFRHLIHILMKYL